MQELAEEPVHKTTGSKSTSGASTHFDVMDVLGGER
jgi:hypothetical protein